MHQFLTIFSARGDSMIRNAESGSWRRMSQFHLLSDDEIMSALNDNSNVIRAVSFDRTTRYAAVELPNHSPYLEISSFRKLVDLLTSLGLKPRIYTASGSKDVQLFLFFSQQYKSALVQESLAKVLSWNGFSLRSDKLVVYPSDVALPLPLQRGFVWLNEDLQPIVSRTEIALDSALALFCSEASRYATDFERVIDGANLLPSADLTAAEFWGLNPHKMESEANEFAREAHVDVEISHITETGSFEVTSDQNDDFGQFNLTKLPLDHITKLPLDKPTELFAEAEETVELFDELPFANNLVRESMELVSQLESDDDDLGDLNDLDEILEPTTSINFAIPQNKPEKPEVAKTFPLWLVEEELGVEVFPVPADQEALEDMLVEESSDEELEQVAIQGDSQDLWPRQSSQLLLVTNEESPDVQLDLFSARKNLNLNKVDQHSARPRRKRPRFDDTQKPEE